MNLEYCSFINNEENLLLSDLIFNDFRAYYLYINCYILEPMDNNKADLFLSSIIFKFNYDISNLTLTNKNLSLYNVELYDLLYSYLHFILTEI